MRKIISIIEELMENELPYPNVGIGKYYFAGK